MRYVYIVGTCDTKGEELAFARDIAVQAGANVKIVDVSTGKAGNVGDVAREEVANHHPRKASYVLGLTDRGTAITAMSEALANYLNTKSDIGAVLGLGGTGNTALITEGMRALAIGVPKLMVSTVASGDVSAYVGANDIAMMYSVTDIAGLNTISRPIIANAARAAAGMALGEPLVAEAARGVGITMFGVTTECVNNIRADLENDFECFVFHATGIGGQSMEKLCDSGLLGGIVDMTTTEVADFLVGGVFACTEDRFGAIARTRVPYVGSVGALDMVNFGALATVPEKFARRKLHVHNAQVTLMRTTPEENTAAGRWIAERLNRCEGPVRFLLPLGGVSALDAPDQPFYDPDADNALFESLRSHFHTSENRKLIEIQSHINDPKFAAQAAEIFRSLMN